MTLSESRTGSVPDRPVNRLVARIERVREFAFQKRGPVPNPHGPERDPEIRFTERERGKILNVVLTLLLVYGYEKTPRLSISAFPVNQIAA